MALARFIPRGSRLSTTAMPAGLEFPFMADRRPLLSFDCVKGSQDAELSGSPPKTVFLVHGLLGGASNWVPFAKSMAKRLPSTTEIIIPTLAGHGNTPASDDQQTLVACADDVYRLARHIGRPIDALIGHSLGGKVALACLHHPLSASFGPRTKVALIDCIPGTWDQSRMDTDSNSILRILDFVDDTLRLDAFPSPSAIRSAAAEAGFGDAVARWLAWNVATDKSDTDGSKTHRWKFCPKTARNLLADHLAHDLWSTVIAPPPHAEVELIVANQSSRWEQPPNARRLNQLKATTALPIHEVEAGHWVHVDNPTALQRSLLDFLGRPSTASTADLSPLRAPSPSSSLRGPLA